MSPLSGRLALLSCVFALCTGAAFAADAAPPGADLSHPIPPGVPPQVVAFGDLRGELLPCGCSPEGQLGGLPRREGYWAALVRRLPPGREPPVLVDLGNNFPEPSAQGRLKIDVIQSLLGRQPVAAILPGPNELQSGYPALDRNLPYLATNNEVPGAFLASRTAGPGDARVLILGYLSPGLVYQASQDRFRLARLDAALLRRYESLVQRERASQAILLFRGDDGELAQFAASGLFTAIVAGNPSGDELTAPTERRVAGYRIPQVPTKGQGAVLLTLTPAVRVRVDLLKEGIPDGAEARAALKAYDERVKALFFAELTARQERAQDSPYVGALVCQTCHAGPFAVWQGTRHTQALHGLEQVGKQYDPECLECHVAGFSRGGFVSSEATPQLGSVQCENCHGPGKPHVANPTVVKPPAAWVTEGAAPAESTCRTCHHGAHSPKFSYADYWPRIQHSARAASR